VSRYQKGKTNLDFTEARDSEWQWHQLGHTHVCTSLQTDTTPAPHRSVFFTGRMPFLSGVLLKMEVGICKRGVTKGLKVPCLFMIAEVSIRCQKNPEVGIRRIPPNTPLPFLPPDQQHQRTEGTQSTEGTGFKNVQSLKIQ